MKLQFLFLHNSDLKQKEENEQNEDKQPSLQAAMASSRDFAHLGAADSQIASAPEISF